MIFRALRAGVKRATGPLSLSGPAEPLKPLSGVGRSAANLQAHSRSARSRIVNFPATLIAPPFLSRNPPSSLHKSGKSISRSCMILVDSIRHLRW